MPLPVSATSIVTLARSVFAATVIDPCAGCSAAHWRSESPRSAASDQDRVDLGKSDANSLAASLAVWRLRFESRVQRNAGAARSTGRLSRQALTGLGQCQRAQVFHQPREQVDLIQGVRCSASKGYTPSSIASRLPRITVSGVRSSCAMSAVMSRRTRSACCKCSPSC